MTFQMTVLSVKQKLKNCDAVYTQDSDGSRTKVTKKAVRDSIRGLNNFSFMKAFREDGNLIIGSKHNPNHRHPSHPDCEA